MKWGFLYIYVNILVKSWLFLDTNDGHVLVQKYNNGKKVGQLDYYGEYCIQSTTRLNNITNFSGCIKQDIRIYNKEGIASTPITTLGNIKEIHSHLNIDEIDGLSDLKIVKCHF